MEFRTCPACKASVLEDDAVDCPFCGASMTTGKPSSTGQAPARKAAPQSAAAAESKGPPAKPTAAAKTKSSASKAAGVDTGGDPFDVDTSAARKATPVRPRPAKGCMIRVTCPMCETPGFVSEAQIGKEVKCCNRECLVPVYVADAPQEKEPEPEPQPEGNSKLWMYVALGVLVVAGVGATFFLRGRKPPAGSGPIERPGTTAKNGETAPEDNEPPPVQPQAPKALTSGEVVAKSLVEMRKAAEYADGSRERALAARLMAETFVLNGEPAKARAEFAGLSNASKYAGIAPLVIEAWRQLAAGDEAKAKAAIEEAFALKELLPKRGSEALDMSANLAASLAAIGRTEDAQALVQNREDPDAGEFTTLWRAAVDGGDYRFDQVVRRTSLQEQAHPQWAAVAQTLTAHERLAEAREWVLAAPDLVIRDNTAGVAAAQAARQLGAGDALNRQIEPLVAALEPAGQARVWSGVGQGLLERDDQAGARDAATKAAAALESISIGAPAVVPEMKELYELADQPNRGLPDPLPARTAALAAFDLFSLESRLGDHQAALPRVQLALQFLQSAAPSAKATGAIVAELDKSPTAVRNRFKETFQLNDAVIVSRFSKYQTQVRAWHEQALDRRDREVRLLSDVALAGASAEVWKAIRAAEESEDPGTSQVYFDTQLPSLLVDLADRQQAAGLRQEITDVLKAREISVSSSSTDQLRAFFSQPVDLNDLKSLIGRLTPYYQRPPQDRALVDSQILALISRILKSDRKKALELAAQLPDTLLREDALFLIGAGGTQAGEAREILDEFNPRSFPKAAAMSLYRGCVDAATKRKAN